MNGGGLNGGWLLLLALAACAKPAPAPPPDPDPCEGVGQVSLSVLPTQVRVKEAAQLLASGGSGHYTFGVEPGGSSGAVNGDRFVAGLTPATDTLFVEDVCGARATATVQVLAAFEVRPARAALKPGTRFQVMVKGTLGAPAFSLVQSGSGGSVSATGLYTAGAGTGLDVLSVRDSQSGDEALLQYDVRPTARFRASPSKLALPAGSSAPLGTADGSDSPQWRVVSGAATLEGRTLKLAPNASGALALEATDPFTGETAALAVRVLDELVRPTRAHGRLADVGATVTGDFDGDGVQDLALGVPDSDLGRPQGGAVFVFKGTSAGPSAEPTWVLKGTSDTGQFGAVLAAGDLDGDGRDDLAVSSPGADVTIGDSGALFLYRFTEAGPEPLRDPLTGLGRAGNFGAALAIADVDGDGDRDLVVGSPGADLAATATVARRGVVDLFLLQKGQPLPDLGAVRLGGVDLGVDGKLQAKSDLRLGRALVVADFNGDGKADLAALGTVNNSLLGGAPLARNQPAVELYFSRGGASPYQASPDLFILPTNTADTGEGTYRLGVVPAAGTRPALLMVVVDAADSPDLSAMGGVKSGSNAGGVLLYELSAHKPSGEPANPPPQLGRMEAFARIYGEAASSNAGRSFAVADVDGLPGAELVLGAPNATGATGVNNAGRLLVYPLDALTAGAVVNKPLDSVAGGAKWDCLGAALAAWAQPSGVGLVALASRASTTAGVFTGRIDFFQRTVGPLAQWMRTAAVIPARPSSELYGVAVATARQPGGKTSFLVGAPGYAGPGPSNDGNDFGAGQAFASSLDAPATAALVAEGASSPLLKGGKLVGADVAFTDFDGDGRQDALIGSPTLAAPGANVRATEIAPVYEKENAGCVPASTATPGGVQVLLGQADGSFKGAYRLWAPVDIAGCTPVGDAKCKRSGVGRMLAGGFDFDGDGKQDLAALRNNGLELYLGRAPDSPTLAKLTMGCDPVVTTAYSAQNTSAPTALGDLDGDGCHELGYRYSDGTRSGVVVLFGFDAGGARCGGKTALTSVRVAADSEVGLLNLGLGVAMTRAGDFVGDGKQRLAISAASFSVAGRVQPAVLLYEVAALVARRPASGEALVAALGDGLVPLVLAHPERPPNFGRALAGDVDLTGDGKAELVVGAPGAGFAGEGTGAVLVYLGGSLVGTNAEPFLIAAGDASERGQFGQVLSLTRGPGAPALSIGAPNSYRTGTQNGTAFGLPLGF